VEGAEQEPPDTVLINAVKRSRQSTISPGDIRRVLSKNSKRLVSLEHIEYKVSYHKGSSGQFCHS
jgi:biotin synthase-related radical SAM superfamily protein